MSKEAIKLAFVIVMATVAIIVIIETIFFIYNLRYDNESTIMLDCVDGSFSDGAHVYLGGENNGMYGEGETFLANCDEEILITWSEKENPGCGVYHAYNGVSCNEGINIIELCGASERN